MSHACHRFWTCYKTLTCCSLLTRCTIPCACHAKRHLNVKKWSEPLVFFYILTSKCASRRKGVHFFDIATSKSGPEHSVSCTVWLRNVLRATTACTFSTSQRPRVVRSWCVLYLLTWKCASRHDNGVQFFISHLPSGLCTRRFSEPTFRPSRARNHWKNTVSRFYYLFGHLDLLSSNTFSSLIFSLHLFSLLLFSLLLFSSLFFCSTSAFHLSIFSEVWLLNFFRL